MQVTGSLTYEMMDHYIQCCVAGDVERALEGLESIFRRRQRSTPFLRRFVIILSRFADVSASTEVISRKSGNFDRSI